MVEKKIGKKLTASDSKTIAINDGWDF